MENNNQKFKIILEYIKDLSIETPSISALTFVRENLSNYVMEIDISSKAVKKSLVEVTTKLILKDKKDSTEQAFFEIKYSTVISLESGLNDKKTVGKIVLCDLQKIIYPKIEKIFLDIIKNAGYPELKFERKVDFENLYKEKFN